MFLFNIAEEIYSRNIYDKKVYKLLGSKKENEKSNKGEEPQLNEKSKNLDSIDIGIKIKKFHFILRLIIVYLFLIKN